MARRKPIKYSSDRIAKIQAEGGAGGVLHCRRCGGKHCLRCYSSRTANPDVIVRYRKCLKCSANYTSFEELKGDDNDEFEDGNEDRNGDSDE